jgi:hypothetical protein
VSGVPGPAGGSGKNEQSEHEGGGDPLDEPEQRGSGAGVLGDLGGGGCAATGADQTLCGHQHEEADGLPTCTGVAGVSWPVSEVMVSG